MKGKGELGWGSEEKEPKEDLRPGLLGPGLLGTEVFPGDFQCSNEGSPGQTRTVSYPKRFLAFPRCGFPSVSFLTSLLPEGMFRVPERSKGQKVKRSRGQKISLREKFLV